MPDDSIGRFGRFGSTHWSWVDRARDEDTLVRRTAPGKLLERYYPALRAHLILGKGVEAHRAEDVLQGFTVDRILENKLVFQADRSKGRFRSLLRATRPPATHTTAQGSHPNGRARTRQKFPKTT